MEEGPPERLSTGSPALMIYLLIHFQMNLGRQETLIFFPNLYRRCFALGSYV